MLLDLTGKKILVTGIANNRSIAWGIAQQLKAAGAELGITYLPDDKGRFEAKVRELTEPLAPSLFLPLNVQDPAQMEAVFSEIKEKWGVLDGLVHCLAFAGKEELIGDYSATTAAGFARALEISAYSLAPLCAYAKPLFSEKAGVITLSYLGAERAIPNYNVMGVAKAALEASVLYLAADFGPRGVRVNGLSAGPVRT
ncbi:MAG: SDR family oxidoreductase, partial [Prochlorococcaceae cyanobacterium]